MNLDAALLAFALCLLAAHRGHAQNLIAHLSERLGRSAGLLFASLLAAVVTSLLAAAAGAWTGSQFIGFGRALAAAAALVLAGLMLSLQAQQKLPEEPTRSYGAIALALIAKQLIDPPRLVIFASAALLAAPWHAFAGGGLATAMSAIFGWSLAGRAGHVAQWRLLRMATVGCLLVAGFLTAWAGYTAGP